jgi:hypothetical protein
MSLLSSYFREYYMMSDSTVNSVPRRGGANVRFMNEPRDFAGESNKVNEAMVWLNKMDRLRKTTKFTDEEILFVVGDHLVGKAETWWNVVGSRATTWDEFVKEFRKHYLADQEDQWWQELQTLVQGSEYPTVTDVAFKMQELFSWLGNKSESYQVRTFLNAIKPNVAFEVEKDGTPATFEHAKEKAQQIEKSLKKYGARGMNHDFGPGTGSAQENVSSSRSSEASAVSSMFSLVDVIE